MHGRNNRKALISRQSRITNRTALLAQGDAIVAPCAGNQDYCYPIHFTDFTNKN